MIRLMLTLCLVVGDFTRCSMESVNYTFRRSPGDSEYSIRISGDPEKYTPNTPYIIIIQGSATIVSPKKFSKFTLSVKSHYSSENPIPCVGILQFFSDATTAFNQDCISVIIVEMTYPKYQSQVVWMAPPAGSGCVVFKANIMENSNRWYGKEGNLTKTICEADEHEAVSPVHEQLCCACDEAEYSVVFEGIWSNKTHPKGFPNPSWPTYFSDLIGASHESGFSFWGHEHIATDGFRRLAEWGSVSGVESELKSEAHRLMSLIKAPVSRIFKGNSNASTSFRVDRVHPLLSAVSSIRPSPDWIVGVSGLNLCQKDCTWMKNMIIDLYPWDAGTDSGVSYTSFNIESKPREKMVPITTGYPAFPKSPFYDPSGKPMLPLARLYLNRERIYQKDCDESSALRPIDGPEITLEPTDNLSPTIAPLPDILRKLCRYVGCSGM